MGSSSLVRPHFRLGIKLTRRFCIAACAVGVPLTGMMAGKRPLFRRIMDFRRQQNVKEDLE